MPTSSDPWIPSSGARVNTSCVVSVYRYVPDNAAGDRLESLPNVQCLSIQVTEGNDPGIASFRYDMTYPGGPGRVEEALNSSVVGDLVVEINDRLVVYVLRPDGVTECMFDGTVLAFSGNLGQSTEEVFFQAVGIARKLWSTPIGGAIYRSQFALDDPDTDVRTDLIAVFNEDGLPNRLSEDLSELSSGKTYHVFVDPKLVRDPDVRSYWSIDTAVRYLLYTENASETYVTNPEQDVIEDALVARIPIEGVAFDYDDLATYDRKTIIAPNVPVTGRDLGGMVEGLIHEHGFGMTYDLTVQITGGEPLPLTTIKFFSPQGTPKKLLYLQAVGSSLSKLESNVAEMKVSRDLLPVVNNWEVHGALEKYEITVVLAPGFPMETSDGDATNLKRYDKSNSGFDLSYADSYRVFVANEAGDGFYTNTSNAIDTSSYLDLETVLGIINHDGTMETSPDLYVPRRRVPLSKLISRDAKGVQYKPRLYISTDYAGDYPGLWDGTGTWQQVTTSEWSLLRDRIGIRITSKTPNSWNIGESPNAGDPYRAGIVKAVEALSGTWGDEFFLRLTCVIEGDRVVKGYANRVSTSATPSDTVTRIVDARDRYEGNFLAAWSEFNEDDVELIDRDDTDNATAEAEARCLATESGVMQGTFTIPYITTYYQIGDRITGIVGRGLSMRTDGNATNEVPAYPTVNGLRWNFAGEQTTTIEISDAGSGRFKYSRRAVQERRYAP